MALERLFIFGTLEDPALHIQFWEMKLHVRAVVSLGKLFLKRQFVSDTREDLLHMLIFQVSWEIEFQINMIVLLTRWPWKGCSYLALWKILLCTFSSGR